MPANTVSKLSKRCSEGSVAELLVVLARFVAFEHTVGQVKLLVEFMDGIMTGLWVGKDTLFQMDMFDVLYSDVLHSWRNRREGLP
jgi:hypothetical protein